MGGRVLHHVVPDQVLKPYGLEAIGQMFAIAGVAGMIVQPIVQSYKFFKTPGRAAKMKRRNILTSLSIAGAIIAAIVWVPLPFSVKCAFEIQPQGAIQVRTMVPGHMVAWNKQPGEPVRRGEMIAKLENIDLQVQEAKYQNEYELAKVRYEQMERQLISDPRKDAMLPAQKEVVASAASLLRQVQAKRAQLLVVSPRDGFVIEPPSKPVSKAALAEDQLPGWAGNPFAPTNSEAVLHRR